MNCFSVEIYQNFLYCDEIRKEFLKKRICKTFNYNAMHKLYLQNFILKFIYCFLIIKVKIDLHIE